VFQEAMMSHYKYCCTVKEKTEKNFEIKKKVTVALMEVVPIVCIYVCRVIRINKLE
jgi:hypothetical protein